jgi:hypothetical protein
LLYFLKEPITEVGWAVALSRSTVPFIPVGINYAAKSARTLVEINFGRPIYESSSDRVESFLDQMMIEIGRLSGF